MALDESQRHELHQRLDDVLGPVPAALWMSQVPSMNWDQVATKDDLAALEARLDERFQRITAELKAEFRGEFVKFSHTMFFSTAGLVLAGITLSFAAARFGG